ncbi:MAG: hypothetical protein AAGC77_06505 [Pseudomonadota bacterium]
MAVAISKQTDRGITVAYKEQSTIGSPETGSGGKLIRFSPSPGMTLSKASVASTESRNDGLARAPGDGRKTAPGTYNGPAAVGAYDDLDISVMRSTFTAANTVDETNAGAITGISSNVVTVTNSTLISTDGLRVGQFAQLVSGFDSGDIGKTVFVAAVTASTVTLVPVDGTSLASATPASWSLTILKNGIQGTTDYAYTIEQYRDLITKGEQFDFVRFGSHGWTLTPDNEIQRAFSTLGRNKAILSSQGLTSPTVTTTNALQSARAKLIIGSSVVTGLSRFSFSNNINPFRDDSVDELTSEIGVGQPTLTGSVTIMEDDLTRVQNFIDGTEQVMGIWYDAPGTAPRAGEGISLTKARFISANPSGLGADRFSTREFGLAIDADLRGGAYDATMYRFSTTSS